MVTTRITARLLVLVVLLAGCKERRASTPAARDRSATPHDQGAAKSASRASASAAPSEVSTIPPTFATLKLVLTGTHPPCNAADCHGPGGPNPLQYQVNDDEQLYATLTHHVSVECGNIPVVTPGDPSRSAIVKVLKGPCSAKVPQMPNGCTPASNDCLPAEYVAAIERWIELGAPR